MDEIITQKVLEKFAFMLGQELLKEAPKDTGKLSKSFQSTARVEGNSIIFTPPYYWEYVEYGSLPHIIRPKNKKALAFNKKGSNEKIVVKEVHHPGNRPNPFVRRTIENKAAQLLVKAIETS